MKCLAETKERMKYGWFIYEDQIGLKKQKNAQTGDRTQDLRVISTTL